MDLANGSGVRRNSVRSILRSTAALAVSARQYNKCQSVNSCNESTTARSETSSLVDRVKRRAQPFSDETQCCRFYFRFTHYMRPTVLFPGMHDATLKLPALTRLHILQQIQNQLIFAHHDPNYQSCAVLLHLHVLCKSYPNFSGD